jgi:hypothetical protein
MYQFNLFYSQLHFAADDYNPEIRIVAAIHKAALWQGKLGSFPFPRVRHSDVAGFSKRAGEQAPGRVGIVIFYIESRTARIAVGDGNDGGLID